MSETVMCALRHQSLFTTFSLWLALSLTTLACTTPAAAQLTPQFPRTFQETVTLPVDNEAAKKLLTIEDRWAAGRWETALDDLVTLVESNGAALVQVSRQDEAGIARYQPVSVASDRWLATLPAAGLRRYRAQIDPLANQLWQRWEQTGRERLLEELLERAYYSSRGPAALQELAQNAFQQGELSRARELWKQLLPASFMTAPVPVRRAPESPLPLADVAARVVICDLLLDLDAGGKSLQQFRQQFPAARGQLAGRDGLWIELLEDFSRQVIDPETSFFERDLPTFGGTSRRTLVSQRTLDPGGELWSVPLRGIDVPRAAVTSLLPTPRSLGYFPAVADDIVYLNDGERIRAWSLFSGRPAWEQPTDSTDVIYPNGAVDEILAPRRPVAGSPLWTVSIANGRLFACLGSMVTNSTPLELRDQSTDLICLDIAAGQGKLLWKLSNAELVQRIAVTDDDAPGWVWEGTPLVDGNRLYGVLSRRRPQLEWSIICLDAESSQLIWHRPVGVSRPTPPATENLASHLLLTASDDRLFLATHWGAIIAVSAHDGHLLWANTYRSELRDESHPRIAALAAHPPSVVVGQRLYTAPADSDEVYCCAVDTGDLLWHRAVPDRLQHLPGVIRNRLIASGQQLWGLNATTGEIVWNVGGFGDTPQGYGRGWLAGSVVYWPSREAISIVEAERGQLLREQPLLTPSQRRFGGNLLAIDGLLLVASADRLSVYGEYSRLEQSHENWLSQFPQNERIRWRLGELALTQQDWPAAVGRWQPLLKASGSNEPSSVTRWQARALDRQIAAQLQRNPEGRATLRDRYAEAGRLARTPLQHQSLLLAELRTPADVDWRLATLQRWWNFLEQSPPDAVLLAPHALTRAQVRTEVQQLRERHGGTPFADAVALNGSEISSMPGMVLITSLSPTSATATGNVTGTEKATIENATAPDSITSTTSGYWRRVWSRPLTGASQPLLAAGRTEMDQQSLLVSEANGFSLLNPHTGREQFTVGASQFPLWSGCAGETLLLVSANEIVSLARDGERLLWRRPRRSLVHPPDDPASPARWHWATMDDSLLFCHPRTAVGAIDAKSGELRWQRNLSDAAWNPAVLLDETRIIGQTEASGLPVLLDPATGAIDPAPWSSQRPWRRPPVLSTSREEWVTVDDQFQITGWSLDGDQRWTFSGLAPHAHADPLPLPVNDHWALLIDGLRLTDLTDNGAPRRSTALLPIPLDPDLPQVEIDLSRKFMIAATDQTTLGVDLARLSVRWRRPRTSPMHVDQVLILDTDTAVCAGRQPAEHLGILEWFDWQTGRLRQRTTWAEAGQRPLQLQASPAQIVVAGQQQVVGFRRTGGIVTQVTRASPESAE